ncbi:hypothetical protein, partial [Corynebacterium belfantii]|uniref:hypothetical protein n=1 Tax=Corynebacterium belfantii TaxID=2014537 RepID=UPI001BB32A08
IADNKLARKFTPDKPNIVFVSDVTEFRVAGRKVYLSPVMDLLGLLRVWLTSSLFRWGGAGKDIDHAEVVFRAVQS